MGLYSGKFGVVNGFSTVRNWNIADTMSPIRYAASNTQWGMGSQPGVRSWSGGFAQYGYNPAALPGELISFLGYTAPEDGSDGNGLRYSGSAMIASVEQSWNWQGGDVLQLQSNFNGHLALAAADGAEIEDVTVPSVASTAYTKIEYSSNGTDFTEWTNLTNATLSLSCALQSYVNSSTVISNKFWTGQKSGNYDLSVSVSEEDNRRTHMSIGDRLVLRMYVNATQYYEIKWVQLNEFTGITVDRESGAIIAQTANFTMAGFDESEAIYADALGHILLPGGAEWWPANVAPTTGAPTTS